MSEFGQKRTFKKSDSSANERGYNKSFVGRALSAVEQISAHYSVGQRPTYIANPKKVLFYLRLFAFICGRIKKTFKVSFASIANLQN